ncbi:UNVERIFIED_CONTAM: hypothetical protein Sradi_0315000 [Sesamum radiatum]|uniref:Uncharacterized protein n=1 Tax=Sesamum radiatum TaxID=300843 RepID=A0AAW2W495_SESRA
MKRVCGGGGDLVEVEVDAGCDGGEVGLDLGSGLRLRSGGSGESGSSVMIAISAAVEGPWNAGNWLARTEALVDCEIGSTSVQQVRPL